MGHENGNAKNLYLKQYRALMAETKQPLKFEGTRKNERSWRWREILTAITSASSREEALRV